MIKSKIFSKSILLLLVVCPISLMVILTITVLLPSLKDPENNIYGSAIGYPALQRMLGQPIKVQTVAVEEKVEEDRVAAAGEAVALQSIDVKSLVGGKVEQVYVAEGDQVRRGQPLIKILAEPFEEKVIQNRNNVLISELNVRTLPDIKTQDLIRLQSNLQTAKEQLAIAEKKLNQWKTVVKEGAGSQLQLSNAQQEYTTQYKNFIQAQQELANAEIESPKDIETQKLTLDNRRVALSQAYRDLENTVIYASTDGLVSELNIQTGEIANPQSNLMNISKDIVFKAYVDQAKLNSIKVGDKATVRLVAYSGNIFQGRVIRLNPTVETNTSKPNKIGIDRTFTYSVWIKLEDIQLTPGLQGFAQFGKEKVSLIIPESSLTHLSAGEGMVMVAKDGKATIKRVQVGKKYDNRREVIGGLNVGEQVVLYPRALNPTDLIKTQIATDYKQ